MKFKEIWSYKSKMIKKLWLNQFAFSLFGLFVASPFNGNICIIAGVFSLLFYISVVGYAVIDDAQKDKIAFDAGRTEGKKAITGLIYAYISFLPSIILYIIFIILTFAGEALSALRSVFYLVIRLALSGEILGIDIGLSKFEYSVDTLTRVSSAPQYIQNMSDYAIFQLIFFLLIPLIIGLIYYLGFTGTVSINTSEKKKKK